MLLLKMSVICTIMIGHLESTQIYIDLLFQVVNYLIEKKKLKMSIIQKSEKRKVLYIYDFRERILQAMPQGLGLFWLNEDGL